MLTAWKFRIDIEFAIAWHGYCGRATVFMRQMPDQGLMSTGEHSGRLSECGRNIFVWVSFLLRNINSLLFLLAIRPL